MERALSALDGGVAAEAAPRAHGPAELAVVVPTFNEGGNVERLVERVAAALAGRAWELVFVDDDSPDGTWATARALARSDVRVRVLRRVGRRGLASACIEGWLSTSAPYVAVMDGDLQHDEQLLPRMLDLLRDDRADVVVGSRYVAGGGVGEWDRSRALASRVATRLVHRLLPAPVQDPLSGFFMAPRAVLEERAPQLAGIGFKILLDLLTVRGERLRVAELPYGFRARQAGASKLDAAVAGEFAWLLAERSFGRVVPVRFVAFAAVGSLGVPVHFAVLYACLATAATSFAVAQAFATVATMIWNFWLNNRLTYRDKALHGARWFAGLATFVAACSVGAVANVGIARYLYAHDNGWALSGLAGVLVGAVWNYAVTGAYTWGGRGR